MSTTEGDGLEIRVNKRNIAAMILVWIISFVFLHLIVHAEEAELPVTKTYSESEIEEILKKYDFSVSQELVDKQPIEVFAARDDGTYAIGTDDQFDMKNISIFSKDGSFMYRYHLRIMGAYELDWHTGYLDLYLIRGNRVIRFDNIGNVIRVADYESSIENDEYIHRYSSAKTKHAGDYEYSLKNEIGFLEFGATDYARLYRSDYNGHSVLLYDVREYQFFHMLFCHLLSISFIAIVFYGLYKLMNNIRQNRKTR